MNSRLPEATVHILSSTVAEVHVGTDVEEVIAPDSRALRDRVVEEIRLLAASTGEPARATLVEGASRWPLVVHPDGTFAEELDAAASESAAAPVAEVPAPVAPVAPAEPVATSSETPSPVFAAAPSASTPDPELIAAVAAMMAESAAPPKETAFELEVTPEPAAPVAAVPAPAVAAVPTAAPAAAEASAGAAPAAAASGGAPPAAAASVPEVSPVSTRELPFAAPAPRDAGKPTVQDLLESRSGSSRPRATIGWQGTVRRATGGLISPAPGRVERSRLDREKRVQRRLDAPRTIVVLNPKGGAHKTTSTLLLAATFGTLRGGATLAWDNNETRGTLGWRAQNAPHHRTAVDLLEDLDRFSNADGSSLAALDTYVRTQVDARFDVLASDEDAAASSTIDSAAFDRLHALLRRYYRLMIVDTGNNMRASNWVAAVAAADQLVIVSTVREDTAASAAWLLDGLREKGFGQKIDEAVTVLTAPSARPDRRLESRLSHHFEQVTSAVVTAPYDPSLVDGGPIDFDALSPETRDAWLTVAATVADRL
jgi:MinD-like ATPase involved in chromosome partitioning or flagellar assembly